jgi:hypothetical protein
MKLYRATMDFCLAADSIKSAAEVQARLIEVAEQLGIFFEYASTGEMTREEIQSGSPLAESLSNKQSAR